MNKGIIQINLFCFYLFFSLVKFNIFCLFATCGCDGRFERPSYPSAGRDTRYKGISSYFCFWLHQRVLCRTLVPPTRDQICAPLQWECPSLTTGLPRILRHTLFYYSLLYCTLQIQHFLSIFQVFGYPISNKFIGIFISNRIIFNLGKYIAFSDIMLSYI